MPVFTKNTLAEELADGEEEIVIGGGRFTRKLQGMAYVKQLPEDKMNALIDWSTKGGVNIIHYASTCHETFGMANIFTDQSVAEEAAAVGVDIPLVVQYVLACGHGGTNTINTILKEYARIIIEPRPGTVAINIVCEKE